jgi:hypothetical protein
MAKLEDVKNKKTSDTSTRTAIGAAALPSLDPLFQASNRLLEGWMAVSSEMLEFGRNRLDRGLEMSRAMAQSTSFNEAIDLQATFTRAIVNDYVSEAHKIVDLGARSLLESFTTLQQQAQQKSNFDYHAHAAE